MLFVCSLKGAVRAWCLSQGLCGTSTGMLKARPWVEEGVQAPGKALVTPRRQKDCPWKTQPLPFPLQTNPGMLQNHWGFWWLVPRCGAGGTQTRGPETEWLGLWWASRHKSSLGSKALRKASSPIPTLQFPRTGSKDKMPIPGINALPEHFTVYWEPVIKETKRLIESPSFPKCLTL